MKKIKFIGAGRSFSTAVTEDGRIYTWGTNAHGELGIGRFSNEYFPTPILVQNFSRIIGMSTGKRHVIAQLSNKELYSWGGGKYGELMQGNNKNVSYPKLIKFTQNEKVNIYSVGYGHTALVTDRKIYLAGKNNMGQIGHNSTRRSAVLEPIELIFFRDRKIKFVQCGHHSTYILVEENSKNLLYVFGDHRTGELGLGMTGVKYYRSPQLNTFVPGNIQLMPTKSFHLDDLMVYFPKV